MFCGHSGLRRVRARLIALKTSIDGLGARAELIASVFGTDPVVLLVQKLVASDAGRRSMRVTRNSAMEWIDQVAISTTHLSASYASTTQSPLPSPFFL